MTAAPITQADWDGLAHELGEARAALRVWQRVSAEREAEMADLRRQLADALDRLKKPPGEED